MSGPKAKPLLQGWAIVDNTIGEDWSGVELSLVAGAPQSFIQNISQPYYGRRPTVPLPQAALLTPQTHEGALVQFRTGARWRPRGGVEGGIPGGTVGGVVGGLPAAATAAGADAGARVRRRARRRDAADAGQRAHGGPDGRLRPRRRSAISSNTASRSR